jgi:four helix bundle protein
VKNFGFQSLEVYTLAKSLVIYNYEITGSFSTVERYALVQQMNRSAVSVASNIAEGYARETKKDKCHFLNVAYGSLMELVCQFEIARDLGYITDSQFEVFIDSSHNLAVKLSNFRAFIAAKTNS